MLKQQTTPSGSSNLQLSGGLYSSETNLAGFMRYAGRNRCNTPSYLNSALLSQHHSPPYLYKQLRRDEDRKDDRAPGQNNPIRLIYAIRRDFINSQSISFYFWTESNGPVVKNKKNSLRYLIGKQNRDAFSRKIVSSLPEFETKHLRSMLVLLSPAKTMAARSKIKAPSGTSPRFLSEATEIALHMTQFSPNELARILKINPKLAAESYRRFQDFHAEDPKPLQAILAYTGVVFKHIRPADFSEADFRFAQDHLRFVSICYGLLRPLDLIKPYRMEYAVKLPEIGEGNMYGYWRARQTKLLIEEVKKQDHLLINLASQEVQPAFDWKEVEKSVRMITPEFKVWKNGKFETIVIYAKMARGEMSRRIIRSRITDPEALKAFDWEGFRYNDSLSTAERWVFTQE